MALTWGASKARPDVPKPPKEEKKPDDPAEDARLVMMRGQHALRQYCSAQRPQTSHGCRGEHNPSTSLSLSESYQRFKSWRDVDGGVTGGATQRGYKKECEGTSGYVVTRRRGCTALATPAPQC